MRVHEVPTAILLRKTALKASVGNDPIDRRPGSGGHLGRAIPHGTGITLAHRTDTRVGKGASAAVPRRAVPTRATAQRVGTARRLAARHAHRASKTRVNALMAHPTTGSR